MPEAELTTMVMIQNPANGCVLVQDRIKKWTGWSFPGGKAEPGESFYDCAVREILEETGLNVFNLKGCGVVDWYNTDNDSRYLVFLYKTTEFSGELIEDSPEGRHFWIGLDALFSAPKELKTEDFDQYFPMFLGDGKYSEAFSAYSAFSPGGFSGEFEYK